MKERVYGVLSILAGFAPWIAYLASAGAGRPVEGAAAALAVAVALNGWRAWRRSLKVLEAAAALFFVAHLGTTMSGHDLFVAHGGVLAQAALAAVAWGSLIAGTPFTYQYAREQWPEPYWHDPNFRRVNVIITSLWGVLFGAGSVADALGVPGALIFTAHGLGAAFSVLYPTGAVRRAIARELRAQNPYDWPAPRPARPSNAAGRHDAIVVGAGIGGLTAAACLAERGCRPLVVEQYSRPGGYCHSWIRNVPHEGRRLRFHFDAGVHDFSGVHPGGTLDTLLRRLGAGGRIEWLRVEQEYVLPDLRLRIPPSAEALVAELGRRFPADAGDVAALFAEMRAVHDGMFSTAGADGGVPHRPDTVDEALRFPLDHPVAFRWMRRPFTEMLDAFLTEPGLKRLLSTLTGYLSHRPGDLSVWAMAPIFGYYFNGGYYPRGGAQKFADTLVEAIGGHGGTVLFNRDVRRIRVADGRVTGIDLAKGGSYDAPIVVSNADLRRTLNRLIDPDHLPPDYLRRYGRIDYSGSAHAVQLGVDFVPDLAPVTMCRGDDGFGVGIAAPCLLDPALAPQGHAAIELLTLTPRDDARTWDRAAPDYAARKRAAGDRLIAAAETALPGLSDRILFREDSTAATYARYAATDGGAIYGPAMSAERPPAKTPIRGLVLAGAGVFPGPGVEAAAISGALAADALVPVRDERFGTPILERACSPTKFRRGSPAVRASGPRTGSCGRADHGADRGQRHHHRI